MEEMPVQNVIDRTKTEKKILLKSHGNIQHRYTECNNN